MEKSIKNYKLMAAQHSLLYALGELLLVFLPAFLFIKAMSSWVGADPIRSQGVIWVANVMMLVMVWTSLKLRGESWTDIGLRLNSYAFKDGLKTFGLSLLVLLMALVGYMVGAIIMANITGMPESADLSKYDFFKGQPRYAFSDSRWCLYCILLWRRSDISWILD